MTYTKKQVAALLGRSEKTIERWSGQVKGYKPNPLFPRPLHRKPLDGSTAPWLWDAKLIDELVKAQSENQTII